MVSWLYVPDCIPMKGTILRRSFPVFLTLLMTGACVPSAVNPAATPPSGPQGIHKIQHVVVIMQENRSFDSYFGTYPGADGIPMQHGIPTVCSLDPTNNQCVKPYHDPNDINHGGGHGVKAAIVDINGGKMGGFVASQRGAIQTHCNDTNDPNCVLATKLPDVMGYHDAREIPNYW